MRYPLIRVNWFEQFFPSSWLTATCDRGRTMRTVHHDPSIVEMALRAGQVRCPACQQPLRPWGRARRRPIRIGSAGDRTVRPRRARCVACRTTHVLLPNWMVARRAYAAPVIWDVLASHAQGAGYRRIAAATELPETTVRDWLREMRRATCRRGSRRPMPAVFSNISPIIPTEALRVTPNPTSTTMTAQPLPPRSATTPAPVSPRMSPHGPSPARSPKWSPKCSRMPATEPTQPASVADLSSSNTNPPRRGPAHASQRPP